MEVFVTKDEMIAQLESEIKSLEAILLNRKEMKPADVAKVEKAIVTLKRIVADLKSGNKP
jgi:hypothetical protein